MDNTEKLLRAFIEAQGYKIEQVDLARTRVPKGTDINTQEVIRIAGEGLYYTGGVDYKVTKKESNICLSDKAKSMKLYRFGEESIESDGVFEGIAQSKKDKVYPGDLFSCGCQVANDDIKERLTRLGFELDRNQMHELMEAIIFHIAR